MLSQIPVPASGEMERWLLCGAGILFIITLVKKVFPRKRNDDEFVTKNELHHELSVTHDKIDARFLTLGEKIETLGSSLHNRLNQLEAGLARVDERTKK